jgi:type IV pilus assembly protein PilX
MRPIPLRAVPLADLGRQSGAVLVVGLIFLAMLTLMGAAAYSVATQQERMTGSSRDHMRAFEAAEAALRWCEAFANGPGATASFSGADGSYRRALPTDPSEIDLPSWWTAAPSVQTVPATFVPLTGLGRAPTCIVEYYQVDSGAVTSLGKHAPPKVAMTRIAAHGWGLSPDSQVTLQSTYVN